MRFCFIHDQASDVCKMLDVIASGGADEALAGRWQQRLAPDERLAAAQIQLAYAAGQPPLAGQMREL